MRKNKPLFFVLVFAICYLLHPDIYRGWSAICHSQSITNSPYSRYGLGDLQQSSFANNIPMGGIYSAMRNDSIAPFFINVSNPASHSSTRLTVFDFGLRNNTMRLETTDKKFTSTQTALSYMAISFPVTKRWGASLGILPYSNVGYKIYDNKNQDSIGTVNYTYEGEGGINQMFLGNGFRIKNFSAGANVSYLFGDLSYFSRDSFPKTSNFFNTKLVQTTRVSDFYFSFGLQHTLQMKNNWSLVLGATGSLQSNINVKKTTFAATYKNTFGVEVIKDTLINLSDIKDKITIPMMLGAGFVFKKEDKWLFGFDYSTQKWSAFNSFSLGTPSGGQQGILKDSRRVAIGIQFIPNKSAGTKEPYYKKVFYRAGFRYADTYLELRNTALKDYAITFGAGFPLRKTKIGEIYSQSVINIGFEIGQRGTTENQLIREQYINAIISFTLNDRWFIKRKYD